MKIRMLSPLVSLVALVACGSSGAGPNTQSSADRVEVILEARQAVEEPAVALGTAALTLADRFELLATINGGDLPAALDQAEDAAADLEHAAASAADVAFERSTADIAAAAAALQAAAAQAQDTSTEARTVVDVLRRAADADDDLAEIVAGWEERGSRQELMDHFDDLRLRAEDLVGDLEVEAQDAGCSAVLDLRVAAARAIAAATAELRDLVANYRGNEYDVRQPELSVDPYGLGTTLFEASQDNGFCPLVDVVDGGVTEVTDALGRLQQALAPDDL